eukprot:EC796372.1.p2 GENE.EC796372.1~~EC796372.1.p2  ORF type:complete len:69 (-),score=4.28 EC796372.1:102-308(-)
MTWGHRATIPAAVATKRSSVAPRSVRSSITINFPAINHIEMMSMTHSDRSFDMCGGCVEGHSVSAGCC